MGNLAVKRGFGLQYAKKHLGDAAEGVDSSVWQAFFEIGCQDGSGQFLVHAHIYKLPFAVLFCVLIDISLNLSGAELQLELVLQKHNFTFLSKFAISYLDGKFANKRFIFNIFATILLLLSQFIFLYIGFYKAVKQYLRATLQHLYFSCPRL